MLRKKGNPNTVLPSKTKTYLRSSVDGSTIFWPTFTKAYNGQRAVKVTIDSSLVDSTTNFAIILNRTTLNMCDEANSCPEKIQEAIFCIGATFLSRLHIYVMCFVLVFEHVSV